MTQIGVLLQSGRNAMLTVEKVTHVIEYDESHIDVFLDDRNVLRIVGTLDWWGKTLELTGVFVW